MIKDNQPWVLATPRVEGFTSLVHLRPTQGPGQGHWVLGCFLPVLDPHSLIFQLEKHVPFIVGTEKEGGEEGEEDERERREPTTFPVLSTDFTHVISSDLYVGLGSMMSFYR